MAAQMANYPSNKNVPTSGALPAPRMWAAGAADAFGRLWLFGALRHDIRIECQWNCCSPDGANLMLVQVAEAMMLTARL
jgi:hypothetical protein